jgi:hypothetical protein
MANMKTRITTVDYVLIIWACVSPTRGCQWCITAPPDHAEGRYQCTHHQREIRVPLPVDVGLSPFGGVEP